MYDVFVLSKLILLKVRPYQIHYIPSDAYGPTEGELMAKNIFRFAV